jgi:hypothetical protein
MMRPHLSTPLALLAAWGLAACGNADPPSPSPSSVACLHYARHLTGGQCGAPALPPAEVARVVPRWAAHCETFLATPGSTVTAAALDECLTLLEAGACGSYNLPPVCLWAGTLSGGAACNQLSVQCQSGAMGCVANPNAAGPCGTCLPPTALGQPCDPLGTANTCAVGSTCSGSDAGASCAAFGQSGAKCLGNADCASGLNCSASLSCAPPTPSGAACSSVFECAYPLVCNINADMSTTCQPAGPAGAPCLSDEYCASGLACSATQTCEVLVWKAAGEPCDGDLARCMVGACPVGGTNPRPVCPAVLADGAPCTPGDPAQVCDVAAECLGGQCARPIAIACQ